MTDLTALQRLMTWFSPGFPVGGFAWSAGLESAIEKGWVKDSADSENWVEASLSHGALATDAILLAHAHRHAGDAPELVRAAELCLALTPARERHDELLVTGDAFRKAAAAWPLAAPPPLPGRCPYPVAAGALAAAHGIAAAPAMAAYLTAAVGAQVSVAVRLIPIGQTEGLRIAAALEPQVAARARAAASATLEDIATAGYAQDIAAMAHETLATRVFRS